MYRRIEMIFQQETRRSADDELQVSPALKAGLMACGNEQVIEAWFEKLNGPGRRGIPRNAKFYFTEAGWREVGRHVARACLQTGQEYRIIKVKENAVNVVWQDEYEVAAQPRPRLPRALYSRAKDGR